MTRTWKMKGMRTKTRKTTRWRSQIMSLQRRSRKKETTTTLKRMIRIIRTRIDTYVVLWMGLKLVSSWASTWRYFTRAGLIESAQYDTIVRSENILSSGKITRVAIGGTLTLKNGEQVCLSLLRMPERNPPSVRRECQSQRPRTVPEPESRRDVEKAQMGSRGPRVKVLLKFNQPSKPQTIPATKILRRPNEARWSLIQSLANLVIRKLRKRK
mmetsp:Transcript_6671/g.13559  ORF Transcript_6671/g.13559 Transcript_6671/m.13559 type:complete len:213 (+) Transcript_6671:357-995(+)